MAMETVGERLKKLRLEKGISLEEVHKKTKIHLSVLRAIEEDGLINFSPVYIKGFIKIYCKLLGVDPKDYIPDYKELRSVLPVSRADKKPLSLFKTISVKLVSLKDNTRIKIKPVFMLILMLIFLSVGLFNLGRVVFLRRAFFSQKTKPALSSIVAKTEGKAEKSQSEKFKISGPMRLDIRAKDDCWIHLKIDGRVVFQNILKKGRAESWQAKDKIELSLGNAGAVDLQVNGKLISNLGKKGQVLKNILITREGLTILR